MYLTYLFTDFPYNDVIGKSGFYFFFFHYDCVIVIHNCVNFINFCLYETFFKLLNKIQNFQPTCLQKKDITHT
jgi:hypothetical protein